MTKVSTDSFYAELKSMPRAAWILFAGTFVNRFGAFVMPFLALYMTKSGYSQLQAGAALTSYAAGHLFAAFLGGYLADRIGRRKTIAGSMFASGIFVLLLSQAWSLPTFIGFAFLAGLVTEMYRPAAGALLTDLVPPEKRIAAFTLYRLFINLGWALGLATAGFVAQYSYFWLFAGDAATALIFGVVALVALPHGLRSAKHESGWGIALKTMAHQRRYLYYLLATAMAALIYIQWSSTFPLHIKALGFKESTYGLICSLNGLLIVLFELPISAFVRRFDPRRVMATGFIFTGLGFGAIVFASPGGLLPLILAMAVFTLGEMVSLPSGIAYVSRLAPEHMRGRYMAANGMTWSLAFMIGPGLGMALLGSHAPVLWIGGAFLGVLAALFILLPVPDTSPDG
jgi:MFS family permease